MLLVGLVTLVLLALTFSRSFLSSQLVTDFMTLFAAISLFTNMLQSSALCRIRHSAEVTPVSIPECLCIDEIYAIKYRQKIYACVLVDMQTSQVYDLLPSRRKADLSGYFSRISPEERDKVKYICMDMFQLYKDVAEVYFPCAKICIDSFHVIQQVNNAFNTVRIK